MKFYIEDLLVVFPYSYIYPEQLEYMTELKKGLDRKGHIVLEMPSGTGKTISLLSLLVAYLQHHPFDKRKVVYCTRTVVEMTKTMEELRRLIAHWKLEEAELLPLRAICLTARKNLCVNTRVVSHSYSQEVDAACRSITASWTAQDTRCSYFDNLESKPAELPTGVFSVEDLKAYAAQHGVCPYFLVQKSIAAADILVHSYLYMVDPNVSGVVKEHLNENAIIVMDEGHNVDDVCIEAMSMIITKRDAGEARDVNMKSLNNAVNHMKATNRQQLESEYSRLVDGLALAEIARGANKEAVRPELPKDVAEEAIPGNLRQAGQFLQFLQRIVDFIYRLVTRITRTCVADPLSFITKMKEDCAVDVRSLRFTEDRLAALLNTLQIADVHSYRHVTLIAQLCTTLATYYNDNRHEKPGFVVICEACDPSRPFVPDPVLRLVCTDASLAVRDVFANYKSVVLTSGTLSPLDIYPKVLGFTPVVSKSLYMTLSRKCIAPVIVTRSNEQVNLAAEELTSSFKTRQDLAAQESVVRAYANLLMDLALTVPDGIVCFFTGYQYMGEVMLAWYSSGFLQELGKHKLIFVETQGVHETSVALANYRRACDIGRGAIFMSIARGKIAEGIDFDRHYGRAVVMFGVPFLPPTDEPLRQRMHWMEACLNIPESEYRNFDAMRQASQCIGRVLRNKTDYGMMILVDKRFALSDKLKKFPNWIRQCFRENTNLSIDGAVAVARSFFREMSQPWDQAKDLGVSLLSYETLCEAGHMQPKPPSHDPAAALGDATGADLGALEGVDHEQVRAVREPLPSTRKRARQI
jgi:DNA excision repair protein ERCC-2